MNHDDNAPFRLHVPSMRELQYIDERYGFGLFSSQSPSICEQYHAYIQSYMQPLMDFQIELENIHSSIDHHNDEDGDCRTYTIPSAHENGHNAWFVQTHIQRRDGDGDKECILNNYRIVVKDGIGIRGLPMRIGSAMLDCGTIARFDATVVRRSLDCGAIVCGIANCEDLCASGGSRSCVNGIIVNPIHHRFTSGGSSSGCAVLVHQYNNEVDMAIGSDQGGSIRIPASFCGLCGLKPTFGLIPYTGCLSIECSYDHLGPITRTVEDNARLLTAIAGLDNHHNDSRQESNTPPHFHINYLEDLQNFNQTIGEWNNCFHDIRIGVVDNAFTDAHERVKNCVYKAIERMVDLGGQRVNVRIPIHNIGSFIWCATYLQGTFHQLWDNNMTTYTRGIQLPHYIESMYQSKLHNKSTELSHAARMRMILGAIVNSQTRGVFYAKASNIIPQLRMAYDKCMDDHCLDALIMPTTLDVASPIPPIDDDDAATIDQILGPKLNANTSPFNVTGHPAISIPCGYVDVDVPPSIHQQDECSVVQLPVGMMIVARHWHESLLYRIAYAYEQSTWTTTS